MKATFTINGVDRKVDLAKPLDISIPLTGNSKNPSAWYVGSPSIEPVTQGDWTAKVAQGAAVNFNEITFNPHAHGTHTECVGHISAEFHSVNDHLKDYFFLAQVITVKPVKRKNDAVITKEQLEVLLKDNISPAVVIRTLPNTAAKKSKKYSNTNWPYLEEEAALYLRESGIQHLLIDLPSVDKEKDDGKLLAHKAFWNYPKATRLEATITEFIYVANKIKDGVYLLNLQLAPFHNNAAPSRPVLFKLQ